MRLEATDPERAMKLLGDYFIAEGYREAEWRHAESTRMRRALLAKALTDPRAAHLYVKEQEGHISRLRAAIARIEHGPYEASSVLEAEVATLRTALTTALDELAMYRQSTGDEATQS